MPFEFIKPDLPTYNFNYDLVDKIGHWVLVTALFFAMLRARGEWRRFYLLFTIISICYAVFSDIANLAIDVNGYYTGDPYDILLIAVEFAFVYLAMQGRWIPKDAASFDFDAAPDAGKSRWQIPALIGTAATLSTPAIGLVLLRNFPQMDPDVRHFRLVITLVAVVLLVSFVFFKQILLQSDLVHSLSSVSQAYSDLKNVQDQLVQSEKLASMGRLLAGTAHEINNPLTAILGYSDLLSSDEAADVRSRTMAEKIGQQARRTKLLVEDLLKFSQQTPTQRSVNSIQVLLSNAIKIAAFETGGGIQVEFNPGTDLPLVEVDTGQILQVFVHLIRNASDAMRESPLRVLHISTRSGHGQVQIEFADSGPGVRDPDLVFDPFYTTKSPGKGVGLGLSACYGIVQKHGGQITCRNRPHGGAIFTVTLPAAEQQQIQNV